MLSNPFCLMLQVAMVILGNQASTSACAASTTLRGVVHDAGGHSSTLGECGIMDPRFPRATDRDITSSAVTSCHMPHRTAIKAPDELYFTSGRGGSEPGNMLSNPFCLMLQVAMVILGNQASTSACAASTTLRGVVHDAGGHSSTLGECGIMDPRFPRATDRDITSSAVTSCHMPHRTAIKAPDELYFTSGRGGSEPGNMLSNPFCLMLQVSRYMPTRGYRSDNRFLLLLPCPLCVNYFLSSIVSPLIRDLLVCGDVEENPGPSDNDLLQKLLNGQSKILATIQEIQVTQNEMQKNLSKLTERTDDIERRLGSLSLLSSKVDGIESSITHFEEQFAKVTERVDDLENRSRRNNLIIYGLHEARAETTQDLERKVKDEVFHEKLGMSVTGIERCHRLGRKSENKARPVILKFLDYREKIALFKASHKLKGSELSLSEDFSRLVRDTSRLLWESAQKERQKNMKVRLVYDKLSTDGTLFSWDAEKKSRYKLQKSGPRQ
uniref:Tick transposon n=1 Tax=Rhipicephalus pulchellus TaxID=72859 RepID=L7LY49_RHIPC